MRLSFLRVNDNYIKEESTGDVPMGENAMNSGAAEAHMNGMQVCGQQQTDENHTCVQQAHVNHPHGKLVVIEGLDGSGKATQTALLCKALEAHGKSIRKVSFPDYDSNSSALVKMYLAGQFGTNPSDVNAYAASSFYAVDRYASYKKDWGKFYEDGGIVIADRYTTSNAIHQCSKLPEKQWDDFLKWLFEFEYQLLGIPTPDMVIYLQIDSLVSQKLMSIRYESDESKKDIHESNLDYLNRSKKVAEYCADKLGWKTVHCVVDGEVRSIEEIHEEIIRLNK
jgi:thymidylate kinase (EC 2.7.4.9)